MSKFPKSFRHIHLALAREDGHPNGDADHGYDILAPLTPDGFLDGAEWRDAREMCRVRRFRPHEDDHIGQLVHGPGGRWFIAYPGDGSTERGYHFQDEQFVVGEYVSVLEDAGVPHTFRVTRVVPLD